MLLCARMANRLPTWQRRIHMNVSAAIRTGSTSWGRRYGTFLARELKRLDDAFGKPVIRQPNLKKQQAAENRLIIERIVASNPGWTVREIAQAAGVSVFTAHKYRVGYRAS